MSEYLKPRPTWLPPMSAKTWETMDESLFRAIYTSNLHVLGGIAALEAIEKRAKALGLCEEEGGEK